MGVEMSVAGLDMVSVDTAIHPEHHRIVQTVRNWFHLPFQGMGYLAEKRRWGTYWNNARIYTSGFPVAEVGPFMEDLRQYYCDWSEPVYLYIDNPDAELELGPALCQVGWQPEEPELYLAHVGPVARGREIPGLEIWPVCEWNLAQVVTTRLRAFADSDETSDPVRVRAEIARRERELSETGRGLLARVNGEPAGVIWWHEEPLDIWVNQIGVRIPFRRQGIASELLRQCTEDAYYRGYRSVLLNVTSDNRAAIRLYRKLGFLGQVYKTRRYVLDKGA
ncbi:MAG: hypothetical protein Kow0063_11450 [Anaerolineae bacterium]